MPGDDALKAFLTVDDASAYLDTFLRPGDLVLLKGSSQKDDLPRIVLDRIDGARPGQTEAPVVSTTERILSTAATQAVIGLGNAGEQYRDTPHNIGQRVVDLLADRLEATWERRDDAMLARGDWQGEPFLLVKSLTNVNRTGQMLRALGERLGFAAPECILVYDDIDLPPGKIRQRMSGGAGGHNGVNSIIQAFQSEELRRVKIGVGRPPAGRQPAEHVVTPIAAPERPLLEKACAGPRTRSWT
jgi:aminoacyl-tRNA hydrolase